MYEKWVKILETMEENKILKYLKKEFDENNIKYKIDLEEGWEGNIRTPNYIGKFVVYVQDGFESKTEEILSQYYENNGITSEEVDEIEEDDKDDTELESKKIAKKQKMAIKIYIGIIICMVMSIIVAGILAK